MLYFDKHVILIGFKHVGKSLILKKLGEKLHKTTIDLDDELELLFEKRFSNKLKCREIMHEHGQSFFRTLESEALLTVINLEPCLIGLGGGAILYETNQNLIKSNLIINIQAPKNVIYERIMQNGLPAFFSTKEDPVIQFNRHFTQREKIYKDLANFTVNNINSIELSVQTIMNYFQGK